MKMKIPILLIWIAGALTFMAPNTGGGLVLASENRNGAEIQETAPIVIQGKTVRGQTISEAPVFVVPPRKELLEMYPCSDCHEDEPVNAKERVLEDMHEDIMLVHGSGRFWCLTCHDMKNNALLSLKGKPIDFDEAYILCGQCHFQRQKDWYFGGHGKRMGAWREPGKIPRVYDSLKVVDRQKIGKWRGRRIILSCPECHNPHAPAIKPFKPSPPPKPRKGLKRSIKEPIIHKKVWDILAEEKESN